MVLPWEEFDLEIEKVEMWEDIDLEIERIERSVQFEEALRE